MKLAPEDLPDDIYQHTIKLFETITAFNNVASKFDIQKSGGDIEIIAYEKFLWIKDKKGKLSIKDTGHQTEELDLVFCDEHYFTISFEDQFGDIKSIVSNAGVLRNTIRLVREIYTVEHFEEKGLDNAFEVFMHLFRQTCDWEKTFEVIPSFQLSTVNINN